MRTDFQRLKWDIWFVSKSFHQFLAVLHQAGIVFLIPEFDKRLPALKNIEFIIKRLELTVNRKTFQETIIYF